VNIGRKESVIGAHCTGHNSNSIGICYIGGLDTNGKAKDTRTDE
jgi:N-acetylmuramoyl-L-alanine amidase